MYTPFHKKFDRNKIFFTSDLHLNHKNICKGTSVWPNNTRDFVSLDEMNQSIIDSINNVVGEDSTLFILGDVLFGDKSLLPLFRSKIKCKEIHLCYGNHDDFIRKNKDYQMLFSSCNERLEIFVGKNLVSMCHYAEYVWRDSGHGTYSLFGHSHGNLKCVNGRMMDVGWDCFNRPISYNEIDEILSKIPIHLVDHHNNRSGR